MEPPKVLPPHYFFLALIFMLAIGSVDSSVILAGEWYLAGLVPIALGIGLVGAAARQFAKAETNIVPLTKSTTLVCDGMFAMTRNPMYTGMTSALVGSALVLNGYLSWLVIFPFVLIIRQVFIRREEALMEETFGEEYNAYRSRVRRWI